MYFTKHNSKRSWIIAKKSHINSFILNLLLIFIRIQSLLKKSELQQSGLLVTKIKTVNFVFSKSRFFLEDKKRLKWHYQLGPTTLIKLQNLDLLSRTALANSKLFSTLMNSYSMTKYWGRGLRYGFFYIKFQGRLWSESFSHNFFKKQNICNWRSFHFKAHKDKDVSSSAETKQSINQSFKKIRRSKNYCTKWLHHRSSRYFLVNRSCVKREDIPFTHCVRPAE